MAYFLRNSIVCSYNTHHLFLTFILNKNNNWRQFIIFLIFNFVYSSAVLFPKLKE